MLVIYAGSAPQIKRDFVQALTVAVQSIVDHNGLNLKRHFSSMVGQWQLETLEFALQCARAL